MVSGPLSYRDFRETGPWFVKKKDERCQAKGMKIPFAAAPTVSHLPWIHKPIRKFFRGNQQQLQQSRSAACAMVPNNSKPAKLHKARWAIQLLNHLLGLPNRASSRYFQERSSTVAFILKFFPYKIENLLNINVCVHTSHRRMILLMMFSAHIASWCDSTDDVLFTHRIVSRMILLTMFCARIALALWFHGWCSVHTSHRIMILPMMFWAHFQPALQFNR